MKIKLLGVAFLLLTAYACTANAPQPQTPALPRNEDEVPRISLTEAKAALDSGAATLVDVRSAEYYASSHVAGAISIPLQNIENGGVHNLSLEKDQWIITYCT